MSKALIWHFISHFSVAFTAAVLAILAFNGIASGSFTVERWLVPFGVGLAVGIVTTVTRKR